MNDDWDLWRSFLTILFQFGTSTVTGLDFVDDDGDNGDQDYTTYNNTNNQTYIDFFFWFRFRFGIINIDFLIVLINFDWWLKNCISSIISIFKQFHQLFSLFFWIGWDFIDNLYWSIFDWNEIDIYSIFACGWSNCINNCCFRFSLFIKFSKICIKGYCSLDDSCTDACCSFRSEALVAGNTDISLYCTSFASIRASNASFSINIIFWFIPLFN